MAFQTDENGNIFDDGQPSPVQITVTPQSKLPVDYGNSGDIPPWVNLDNSQFDQTAFDAAAERLKRGADHRLKLPVSDDRYNLLPSENPTYMMQPDLQNTQAGDVPLPPGAALNDAGQPYWTATGQPVPVVDRPGILPFARTPEGIKLAMPKMLDLASNIVGGGVAAKVPVKAGEMVLGSGIARTAEEVTKKAEPFYSQLERSVSSLPNETMTGEQWWKKIWEPASTKQVGIRDTNNKPTGEFKNVETQARSLLPGVKQEELETLGVEKWLKDQKGPVSKQQLEDYIKQNKVELKEKVLGDLKELPEGYEVVKGKNGFNVKSPGGGFIASNFPTEEAAKNGAIDFLKQNNNPNPTKYHQYQLPGGENYKEMLLKLPANPERQQLVNKHTVNRLRLDAIDERLHDFSGILDNEEVLKLAHEKTILGQEQKELARKLDAAENKDFIAPHFGAPDDINLLAHIRMNDRIVDSKKILHIEEIQSDLHQQGRDKGYKGEKEKLQPAFDKIEEKLMATNDEKMLGQPRIADVLNEAVSKKIITPEEAKTYKRYTDIENSSNPVPDFPFKNNWEELAIKRIIRHAAENEYDGISWEHGNAQALRYPDELRKSVNSIEWHNKTSGKAGDIKHILVDTKSGPETTFDIDKNGTITNSSVREAKGKHLSEVIGKQMAGDILDKAEGNINAKDFVMGAEGMKSAYDVRIPNKFNEIGKKYGSKVEQRHTPLHEYEKDALRRNLMETTKPDEIASKQHSKLWDELVSDMKAIEADKDKGSAIYKQACRARMGQIEDELKNLHGRMIKETVDRIIADTKGKPIHYFPLTPALKAKALNEGFPLFSSSPILTPISHNPFNDQQQNQNFKLVPVAGNPFAGSVGK